VSMQEHWMPLLYALTLRDLDEPVAFL